MSNLIEVKCDQCGKMIKKYYCQIKRNKNYFCSKECFDKFQVKKIEVKCDYCGKKNKKISSQIKNHKHHFCDKKCEGKWRYKQKEILCDWCGEKIKKQLYTMKRPYHFCNNKCEGKWVSKFRAGENSPSWRGGGIEVKCDFCGKKIKKIQSHIKNYKHNFCNIKCMGSFYKTLYKGENCIFWRDGRSKEPYTIEFDDVLKEKIRKRDNFTCQECNHTQEQLGYTLHVHHVDYNKKNNNLNNLISLCRSCHAQTTFNRDDWADYYQEKIAEIEQIGGINDD